LPNTTLTFYSSLVQPPEKAPEAETPPQETIEEDAVLKEAAGILTYRYPYVRETMQQAVFTVTELKEEATEPGTEESFEFQHRKPAFLYEQEARHRGIVVHRFLQHFNPASDPKEELRRLCEAGVLGEEERDLVDLDAVLWFLNTETGKRFRAAGSSLLREVPFLCRLGEVERAVTIRGVVDAVLLEEQGIRLIDFKTDVTPDSESLRKRTERYRFQLLAYSWALQSILGRKVLEAALVFLYPRKVVIVPEAAGDKSLLEAELTRLVWRGGEAFPFGPQAEALVPSSSR